MGVGAQGAGTSAEGRRKKFYCRVFVPVVPQVEYASECVLCGREEVRIADDDDAIGGGRRAAGVSRSARRREWCSFRVAVRCTEERGLFRDGGYSCLDARCVPRIGTVLGSGGTRARVLFGYSLSLSYVWHASLRCGAVEQWLSRFFCALFFVDRHFVRLDAILQRRLGDDSCSVRVVVLALLYGAAARENRFSVLLLLTVTYLITDNGLSTNLLVA